MTFLVVSHSTGRTTPNSYNVQPVTVWKVYPDGSEELVRGVDMIGTPLLTFSRIKAASDTQQVFNGSCGAESAGYPYRPLHQTYWSLKSRSNEETKAPTDHLCLHPTAGDAQ